MIEGERRFSEIALALTFLLSSAVYGQSVAPTPATADLSHGFSVIDGDGGWRVPIKGKPFGTTTKEYGKDHIVVKVLRYKTIDSFALPHHWESREGALELFSPYFYSDEIDAIEYNGVRFSYFAVVRGTQISMVSAVRWLDIKGKGVFSRIVWGPNEPDIPQWVFHSKEN